MSNGSIVFVTYPTMVWFMRGNLHPARDQLKGVAECYPASKNLGQNF